VYLYFKLVNGTHIKEYYCIKIVREKPNLTVLCIINVFAKIKEQKGRTGPARQGGLAAVGGGRWWEKGIGE
jgi:hypothetical protein